jgi:ribonucleoside-diphosphate reductase alpha chain
MNWLNPSQTASEARVKNFEEKKLEKNKHIELTPNARTILEKRYLRKNGDGTPAETIEGMFERIADVVAAPDASYRDVKVTEVEFYNLLTTKRFFPNSPTFTGAGTPLGQLAACFVLPIDDDLGRQRNSIFETLRVAALIQQTGGGNGFSFSRLRRKGSIVGKSSGKATGPIGFLQVYDSAFGEVAQGGVRRGANMGVLRVDHPDVREFITCKSAEGRVANFNISVAITDVFMQAVKNDTTYELIEPSTNEVVETPRAREIFDLIVEYAHKNGEPGVLFIDEANRTNPVPHLYSLEATNPCGEQWLGPYESCCLGSINLGQHLDPTGRLDWEALRETIELSTRFLDNVVTANKYVPEVPELKEAAFNARRIGLGFMGLADIMYSMGIRYGSDEGQEFAAQLSEFMRFHAMKTSVDLARERGPFLKIDGSIYDPDNMQWQPPVPLKEYKRDFDRPQLDWDEIVNGIKKYGIRNAAQTTIAPTGTISTVAGVEGYGCEPVFALAYLRNVYQAAGDAEKLTLTYVSPMFEVALNSLDLAEDVKEKILKEIVETGTCQQIEELPARVRNVFAVSQDVMADEHILMQASIQAFIDNSISKTCNFPENATKEDVANAYLQGWEFGCKGLTVYVTGSRQEVVLETKGTKDKKSAGAGATNTQLAVEERMMSRDRKLIGTTYQMKTPQGKAFITVNRDRNNRPFEIFVNVGKAGSDVAALSEALGRLMSGWLRASVNPEETVKEIIVQLIGIGGSRSVGFGNNRVSSIPDATAKVLAEEFGVAVKSNGSNVVEEGNNQVSVFSHVDMCPECGNSSFVKEEGCSKCYECGYSHC